MQAWTLRVLPNEKPTMFSFAGRGASSAGIPLQSKGTRTR